MQVDLQNPKLDHESFISLRYMFVNQMIEMFNHNKSNFSEQTKFRAISIMDYYLSLSDV